MDKSKAAGITIVCTELPANTRKMKILPSLPAVTQAPAMDSRYTSPERDLEAADSFFDNSTVQSLTWQDLTVTVQDRNTAQELNILDNCNGTLQAAQVVALMGPSGSGKTTLLNVLANRSTESYSGQIQVNGHAVSGSDVQRLSAFVEQEDSLIGSLTAEETVNFTARLATTNNWSKSQRRTTCLDLLSSLGLSQQKNTLVGTPLRKGISGGQKRRLSVAVQLLAGPKVLFLDEPTSGLDSIASYEVMKFISEIAKKHKLLVIASIHQPSTSTFDIFDTVLLLSKGQTCYFGPTTQVTSYFNNIYPVPIHTNPAEYLLELVNTDFVRAGKDEKAAIDRVATIVQAWHASSARLHPRRKPSRSKFVTPVAGVQSKSARSASIRSVINAVSSFATTSSTLLHRSLTKSIRDFLAYGTRLLMYTGLAIMMGTVWLRLPYIQSSIQPFINAIFFGGAFMSFMAVAYVPAILEDVQVLRREHANGLYGAAAFNFANFLVGIPWLFLFTFIFSVISYWLGNFQNNASPSFGAGFGLWMVYLFLDLLAAESLVVLISALTLNFVLALAATAFANGLWMAVGGFLVPLGTLNVFWRYVFHYIDYQAYVFQGMMVNQFEATTYRCGRHGQEACMYISDLVGEGRIAGTAVLDAYHISHEPGVHGRWVGIMIGIIAGYRLLAYLALRWRTA